MSDEIYIGLDEADHRLLLVSRKSSTLIVLDSDSGKIVATLPCADMVDDLAYDPKWGITR